MMKQETLLKFQKSENSILAELGIADLPDGDSPEKAEVTYQGDAKLKEQFEKTEKIVHDANAALKAIGGIGVENKAALKEIKEKAFPEFQKSMATIREQWDAKQKQVQKEVEELRAEFQKSLNDSGKDGESQERFRKSLQKYVIHGPDSLTQEEKANVTRFSKSGDPFVHSTEDNIAGGFLVRPADFLRILNEKAAISSLQDRVSRDIVTTKTVPIPIDEDNGLEAKAVGERGAIVESQMTARQIELSIKRFGIQFYYTQELIESMKNPENRIARKVTDAFKRKINKMILFGAGGDQNEFVGILENLAVDGKRGFHVVENSGKTPGAITLADLRNLWKVNHIAPYREGAVWTMSTDLLADLRFEEGNNGQFKWTTEITDGIPLRLNGQPVIEIYEMDDVIKGGYPIIYGDLGAAYQIIEYANSYMIRDNITRATQAEIIYTFFRFMDGKPTDTKALVVMKVAN